MKFPIYSTRTVLTSVLLSGSVVLAHAGGIGLGVGGGAIGTGGLGVGLGGAGVPGSFGGIGAAGAFGATGTAAAGANGHGWSIGVPDSPAHIEAFESIGMRQERLSSAAAAAGDHALSAPGMEAANHHTISAVLATGPSSTDIGNAGLDTREKLLADMRSEVDAGATAMSALRASSTSLSGESKAEFKAAAKSADARAKALRKSMKTAAKASATGWADSRAKLAADYEAYTAAMNRAEIAAAGGKSNSGAGASDTAQAANPPASAHAGDASVSGSAHASEASRVTTESGASARSATDAAASAAAKGL